MPYIARIASEPGGKLDRYLTSEGKPSLHLGDAAVHELDWHADAAAQKWCHGNGHDLSAFARDEISMPVAAAIILAQLVDQHRPDHPLTEVVYQLPRAFVHADRSDEQMDALSDIADAAAEAHVNALEDARNEAARDLGSPNPHHQIGAKVYLAATDGVPA